MDHESSRLSGILERTLKPSPMKRLIRSTIVHYSSYVLVMAIIVIAYGTLSPAEYLVPSELWSFDKVMHFVSFGVLTGLIWLHLYKIGNTGTALDVKALFWGILAGLLVEVLQYYLPIQRSADLMDFLADALGSIVAVAFFRLINFNR